MDRPLVAGFGALLIGLGLVAGGLLLTSHGHDLSGLGLDGLGALAAIGGVAVLRVSVGLPKGSPPLFGPRLPRIDEDADTGADRDDE